jgi:YD repeat-containing protein
MVAIVTGNAFGIARSSATMLGGQGQLGAAAMGRGNDRVYVNAANGNLVIDRNDEILTGLGPDASYGLTYNSDDASSVAGAPAAWTAATSHRIVGVTGTVNTAGSTATRVDRDGSTTLFTYDAAKGYYTSDDGAGPTNELRFASAAWTWTDGGSRRTERYESVAGAYLIKTSVDADGNAQTYNYNADGTLSTIVDANTDFLSLTWSGGRLSQVTASYHNGSNLLTETRIHYSYDALNRLQTATVDLSPGDGSTADNKVYATTYGYDGNSLRVASIVQTDGSRLDVGYTQSGSTYYVTSLTETVASGVTRVTGLYYDLGQRVTTITDPLGGITTMRYDGAGNLLTLVRPVPAQGAAAPTTNFEYNSRGDVTAVVDNGRRTDYSYDSAGNLTGMHDPAGDTVTRTYGAQNQMLTETRWLAPQASAAGGSGASTTTRYAYDVENHLRFAVSGEGDVTEYRYTPAGQLCATIAYAGGKYDVSGLQPTSTLDEATLQSWSATADRSNAERTDTAYDARGNVQSVTRYNSLDSAGIGIPSAGFSQDVYVYDQAGLLLSRINNASSRSETYLYDGLGRMVSATDMANATTTTFFDDANSTTTVTSLATGLTHVSVYDKAGELLSTTESGPGIATAVTRDDWDGLGRLRIETDATLRKTYHVYDAASRKVADVTADGAVTEYGYDSSNRLVRQIDYLNKLNATQINLLSSVSAGGSGGVGAGGASSPTGPNLLVNGSFDDSGSSYTILSTGRSTATLPGWWKSNPEPFEQVASGQMNVIGTDGAFWLDMDSVPVSGTAPGGPNLVVNGGFEASGPYTPMTTGRADDALPGWSKSNPEPFEQVASGQMGVTASEGSYWLDLDSIASASVVPSPTGANLLVNGSFEQSGTFTTIEGGRQSATLPGWTKTNPQPFFQMIDVEDGVQPSDGIFALGLDTPGGTYATGANLVVNGSFEQSATTYVTTSTGRLNDPSLDIPGWTKTSLQGLEQVTTGVNGTAATDGTFYLDMDATGGADSDADISQTFNGLGQGTQFLLQFDYANTAGTVPGVEGDEASGSLWVYWNDQVVATMESPTVGMITKTYTVTAAAGANTLRFREVGPQDGHGVSLDNVQLHTAATAGAGGNADVKQTVSGLKRGQVMQLQFDHAARGDTGGFQVVWNGGVIATIADSTPLMTTETYYVTASGGKNEVEFRGLGTVDGFGSQIDNVSLYATAQILTSCPGADIVVNGSFEQSGTFTNVEAGRQSATLPGWTKTNPQPFDQMIDVEDGVQPSDGAFSLGLDAAGGTVATGANLVVNGSFEQSATTYVTTSTGRLNDASLDIPGWTKANLQGIEQVTTGVNGTAATDGTFYLDMDATGGADSDTDISQTINGIGQGTQLLLQFDYANTAGMVPGVEGDEASGSLWVYWNDQVIATMESPTIGMITKTYTVTAAAGGNTLRFREVGPQDGHGVSLDNVQLHAAATATAGGNMDVKQTFSGLTKGQIMQLQFDHAGRGDTGGFQILWNGTVIDTVADASVLMESETYYLTASAGSNEVEFRGLGTVDGFGSQIDNVTLRAMQDAPNGGNMAISQSFTTLTAGQQYQLSFDHANRTTATSGSFEVWWNGVKLQTIATVGLAMQTNSYLVTAGAGTNLLEFRGTGTVDTLGASLDNVRLLAMLPVPTGGNMDISQNVTLASAQTLLLQFNHANRTSSASGSFEVWWNGCLIATVTDSGTTMQTNGYQVSGVAGTNTLRFRGIGTTDAVGASLDNVRLSALASGGAPGGSPATDPLAGFRPTASSDDLWTWHVYDTADRVIETLDSLGRATTFAYDGESQLVGSAAYSNSLDAGTIGALKATTPTALVLPTAAPVADQILRSFYDSDGRLVGTLDGVGAMTQIHYDAAGRKIREEAYANPASSQYWPAGSFAQLLGSIAPAGADRRTDYAYDDRGLLRFTIDVAGRPTEFVYDAADRVIRTVDYATAIAAPAGGLAYTVAYVQPRLVAATGDRTTRSTYDEAGRLAFSIDAEGGTVAYRYDSGGNVDRVTAYATAFGAAGDQSLAAMQTWVGNVGAVGAASVDNRVTRTLRDSAGQVLFSVDGESYVTAYQYDLAGRTTSATRYDAAYAVFDSDTAAALAGRIPAGAAGVATSYAYDAAGRQTDVAVGGIVTHFDYDGHGQVTDVWAAYQSADSSRTHRDYDAAGRLRSETRAYQAGAVPTVSYQYDALGNVVRETDRRGSVTVRDYDADGRVTKVTAPLDDTATAITRYTYDALGNVVKMEDPRTNATFYYYDRLGRLTLEVDPLGFGTKTDYTVFGQASAVTRFANAGTGAYGIGTPPTFTPTNQSDPNVTRQDATTQFAYDRNGRVTSVTDAQNASETYVLNAFGERHFVTSKVGGVTEDLFDHRGLLKTETQTITSPNGGPVAVATAFTYYASGNRHTMIEAVGEGEHRTTTYSYDALDRLITIQHDQVTVTDATTLATQLWTPTETTEYDRRGNVVRTVDAAGGTSVYYYDALNRKTETVDAAGAVTTWTYDDNAGTVTMRAYDATLPTPPNPYAAPPAGSGNVRTTQYQYDRAGRLTTTTVYGATTGTDANGAYSAAASANLVSQIFYDATGNAVRDIDARGNSRWCWYDKDGRKIAEVDQENYLTAWTLDAEGNVLKETRYATRLAAGFTTASDPASLAPAASADDRTTEFDYDRDGRRVREKRWNVETYSVSSAGALSAAAIGTSIVEYTYNALGEVRTKKEATGDITTYTYDSAGRLVTVAGPAYLDYTGASVSRTVANSYDGLGDLVSSSVNGARTTSYAYGLGGQLQSMTDAANFTRSYGYDKAGRVVKEQWTRTLSDGVTTATEANVTAYDSSGRVVSQGVRTLSGGSWSAGDLTQFRYNAYGEVAAKGMHDLWQESFDYDGAGRLWRSTAGDGTTKYFLSDAAGNTTLTATSSGSGTSSGIGSAAALVAYLTNNGANAAGAAPVAGLVLTIAGYDGRGQATGTREPSRELGQGQVATLTNGRTYNAFGEVASETDARGYASGNLEAYTTHYFYNTMGRLLRKADPGVAVTDEHGVTTTGVDPIERSFYDVSGRLVATQDPNGNVETRTLLAGTGYDGATAAVLKDFHADHGVVETRYDAFGDAREIYGELSVVDPIAYRETRVYDALDRVTQVTHRGGLLTDTYVYDGLGERIGHWNSQYGSSVVERTDYDAQGRVTFQSDMSGLATATSYAWQQGAQTAGLGAFGGWLKTTTAPGAPFAATETDDYFGRVVARQDFGGHSFGYAYNLAAELVGRTDSAGESLAFTYYNGGQVAGQTGTQGEASYGYDVVGDLVAETFSLNGIARRNATASYDAMNRMTSWQDQGYLNVMPASSAWQYDLNGNVRSVSASYVSLDSQGNAAAPSSQTYWYLYDAMNRMTISQGVIDPDTGTVARGTSGTLLCYDLAGQRKSALSTASLIGVRWEYFAGPPGSNTNTQPIVGDGTGNDGHWETRIFHFQGDRREDFAYNADGTLAATTKADAFMDAGPQPDPSDQIPPEPVYVPPPTVGIPLATYTRDAMGRVTHYFEQGGFDGSFERTNIQYDAAGRELSETSITMRRDTTGGTMQTYTTYLTNSYSNGLITGQFQNNWKGSSDTNAPDSRLTYGYQWWDGAQQQTIGNDNDNNGTTDWTTTYSYDPSGRAGSVYIADGRPRGVSLATDQNGMIVDRTEAASGGTPRTLRYVFGGMQMGEVGNDGTSNTSFAASVADRLAVQPTPTAAGPFHNGGTSGTPFADFDQSYDAINSSLDPGTGSTYIASAGDTLQSIAAMVWGDASLWYLIADANGMSGAEQLQAGRSLTIPDVIANVHNNAGTFRAYNATKAIGDVNPTTPKPVKSHHGCGMVGMIILAAIAIAVTAIATAGIGAVAAGTTFGQAWAAMMGGTLATLGGTTVAGVTVGGLGVAGSIGVAAAGAAAGSIVSQGIGVATGLQQQFNWKAVGLSAISAGIGQGVGSTNLFAKIGIGDKVFGSAFAGNVLRGGLMDAATQGVAVATGLQKKFDWAAVAAAGFANGVGQAFGVKPISATNRSIGAYVSNAGVGMARDIANAAARTLLNGTDFGDNVLAALPDTIAQTITSLIAYGVANPEASPPSGIGPAGAASPNDPPKAPGDPSRAAGMITIESGDTLQTLAARYGISAERIAALNGIAANGTLRPGGHLFIAPDFQVGLDMDSRAADYAKSAKDLYDRWRSLTPTQRQAQFQGIINSQLQISGIPALSFNQVTDSADAGVYDVGNHTIGLDLAVFNQRRISLSDFQALANTIYHEARHAEQYFRIMEFHAGRGLPATTMWLEVGQAPAAVLVRAAYNRPINPDSALGRRIAPFFEAIQHSYFGPGDAVRDNVLSHLDSGGRRVYVQYRNLPEELDAWRTAAKVNAHWPH